jgi:DeoR family transcriptional regulator of aga operon
MATGASNDNGTFPARRRAQILDLLRERGAASIQELAADLGVSPATIRRDLDYLAEHDFLHRERGGAVHPRRSRTTFEPDYSIGSQSFKLEKEAIGRFAAARVVDGQSVIFDSSSTVLEAARAIADMEVSITALTNDLNIAQVLAQADTVRLLVPGGTLRPHSFTLMGEPGREFLEGLRVDLAFIGIHALVDGTLSETSVEIAVLKRAMVRAANLSVLLVDGSKFREPAFCRVVGVGEIDEVVTDDGAAPDELQDLQARGVQVSVVSVSEDGR